MKELKIASKVFWWVCGESASYTIDFYLNDEAMETFEREYDAETREILLRCMKEDVGENVTGLELELTDNELIATVAYDGDVDVKNVIGYLEGQYADGFGEGLEQRICFTETEMETEECEDFDGTIVEEEYEVHYDYSIKLWDFDNWYIKEI